MALPKANKDHLFLKTPAETIVDVVAFKDDIIMVRQMTFKAFIYMKQIKGWTYSSFQKGFHSYKNT